MQTMDMFKTVIMIMLFYSVSITLISYAMPAGSHDFVTSFNDVGLSIDLETVSGQVQDSLEDQTSIPVIELGALVFYSGNILIDLLLNFMFAIPQMIALLTNGALRLFGLDGQIVGIIQMFGSVAFTILYFIGIIQLLTGIRSGRII
jgi:hypothetical protein